MVIYCIKNEVNDKCYIGQTIRKFTYRKSHHLYSLNNNKHDNPYLQHAWNKYNEENFKFVVLEKHDSIKELNKAETFWIQYLRSMYNKDGYNLRSGGKNDRLSKEIIKNMRNAQIKSIGRVIHQYDLDGNYIQSFKTSKEAERILDISHTQIIACCNKRKGYKSAGSYQWSREKKKNIGKINRLTGKFSKKGINKNNKNTNKKVKQYTLNGEYIDTYCSISEAGRQNNIPRQTIYSYFDRNGKTAGGYKWKLV